jgi:hypothetical protein
VISSSILWDITPVARWKSTDISDKNIASIFNVEEQANQETRKKQAVSRVLLAAGDMFFRNVGFRRIMQRYISEYDSLRCSFVHVTRVTEIGYFLRSLFLTISR